MDNVSQRPSPERCRVQTALAARPAPARKLLTSYCSKPLRSRAGRWEPGERHLLVRDEVDSPLLEFTAGDWYHFERLGPRRARPPKHSRERRPEDSRRQPCRLSVKARLTLCRVGIFTVPGLR